MEKVVCRYFFAIKWGGKVGGDNILAQYGTSAIFIGKRKGSIKTGD